MADWRNDLRLDGEGSFRTVAFQVASASRRIGRRLAIHEHPGVDRPFAEDLGRRSREHRLSLFLVGDDYMAFRDLLEGALEQQGPGILVHPYLGRRRVVVDEATVAEESERGRQVRFDVTFVEAGEPTAPLQRPNRTGQVDQGAAAVEARAEDALAEAHARASSAAGAVDAAGNRIEAAADRVERFVDSRVTDNAQALIDGARSLRDGVTALRSAPRELMQQFTAIADEVTSFDDAFELAGGAGGAEAATTAGSDTLQDRADMATAVDRAFDRAMLARAGELAARTDYPSFDAAIATRDAYARRLDAEAGLDDAEASHDLAARLVELRTRTATTISERAADLARLIEFRPPRTMSVLEISQEVYGDARRAEEVLSRNRAKLRHPGFVDPFTTLVLLSE